MFFYWVFIFYISPKYIFLMKVKTKYELEFPINSSPGLLFSYISTPSGLSDWFADNVNARGEYYTFIWNDSEEKARLILKKTNEKIKFRWLDENDVDTDYSFEIKIQEDEITKDVSLVISDYAFDEDLDEAALLWENQVSDLKHVIGSV